MSGDYLVMRANPKIRYRKLDGWPWQYSENGEDWYNTSLTTHEVMAMCDSDASERSDLVERELELFGDTLDEPLPEDFAYMLVEFMEDAA